MNIYDFDETIYDSDSTRDFYFHCLRKYPKILLSVPAMAWAFFLYILGLKTKTQFKEKMYRFLRYVPDIDSELDVFWNENERKIKRWYRDRQKEDDIIISASPEFLLEPICERLGIKLLIASKVDKHTGLYSGENCHGEEKVKRLKAEIPDAVCEEFYSDSLSDTPLAELAATAKIIRGNEIIDWDKYKPSKLKMFLSREFLAFLVVGVINTLSNVVFSTIYSIFIPNTTLAFFPGYITSNVVSYLLNSKLTFNERLGFVKFIKFFISYIPNFVIQTVIVYLFDRFIHGPSVIAYAIAAVIGVPVTFVFMKVFTFRKEKSKKSAN
ncbi:MAG: HAD-IB family phosphatase [Oscillospiraceae bacterium]|nr:HAD-IB family phosphatase [Oscillospiraceae bacterium]